MTRTHDPEVVSIYPFSEPELDQLLTHARISIMRVWRLREPA